MWSDDSGVKDLLKGTLVHSDTFSHENSADPDRFDKDKVLKSDAAMSIEQDRPFDIFIKSEPLDVI